MFIPEQKIMLTVLYNVTCDIQCDTSFYEITSDKIDEVRENNVRIRLHRGYGLDV